MEIPLESKHSTLDADDEISFLGTTKRKAEAEAETVESTVNQSKYLKKGQKFRSKKQIAISKEKARLSMSLHADPMVPLVEGLDNFSTSLPLVLTHHEIVMDLVIGYFICLPSIPCT